jgi:hypothetical protein
VLRVGREDRITHAILARGITDRSQQRERAPLAIHGILPRRERHIAARARATLPNGEANQLQPLERAAREVQLHIRQLPRRIALVVCDDLDVEHLP